MSSVKRPVTSTDVLEGMYNLGQALKGDMEVYAMLILTARNKIQESAAIALYYRSTGSLPTTDLLLEKAWEEYEKIHQPRLRTMLSNALNEETRNERRKEQLILEQEQERLREVLKKTHQPHVLGTVKEIAAKYGISLSEVRRLKAEGRLEDLTRVKAVFKVKQNLTPDELFDVSNLVKFQTETKDGFSAEIIKRGIVTDASKPLSADDLYKVGLMFNVVMSYDLSQ